MLQSRPLARILSLFAPCILAVSAPACVGDGAGDESIEGEDAPLAGNLADGTSTIQQAQSGKCVDVADASTEDGANVQQWSCHGGANQRFALHGWGGDVFEIRAEHSDKCVEVAGGSTANGANVQQWSCHGGANQRWRLTPVSASEYHLVAQNSGKCLQVAGGSLADGGDLRVRTCTTSRAQRFTFARVSGGGGGGGGGGGSNDPAPGVTVDYTMDKDGIFANPERGFYHHRETSPNGYEALDAASLRGYRTAESISLVLRLWYLNGFQNAPISQAYLDAMRTDLARIREAGLKAIVRFAYTSKDTAPYGDAPKSRVLAHIAQMKPILQENSDVIAAAQAGFIGAWGEWYYTDSFGDRGSVSAAQSADREEVVSALLDALSLGRPVQVRTPAFKQVFFGAAPLSAAEAFQSTAKSRVGHHNDCFLASPDDYGTYADVTADKAYLAAETRFVPQGGETCGASAFSGWSNAELDLSTLHYSYLNRDYEPGVLNGWGTNLEIARRRLGYRLSLSRGTFSAEVRPGAQIDVSLKLGNDGYAAPFNPRDVEIVLRNEATGALHAAKLGADPRLFSPGAPQTITQGVCLPASLPEGRYALLLRLADPAAALHARPEYSIRLANVGTWEENTGLNRLNHTVDVRAAATAVPCVAGAAPLSP